MKTFAEIQTELRTILPEGIDITLQALKNYLPPGKDKYNDLLLLEGRYQEINKQILQGVLSFEDSQISLNQLRKDLLDFINNLEEHHLSTTHQDGSPDIYNGEVFYRIPRKMKVMDEVKCIIRVAFSKSVLLQDLEEEAGDVLKDLRISDVMGVELLDPNSGKAFEIRTYSETVQFVEKDLPTEWLFYVKPLLEGRYPLVLKISVVEIKNGIERKRNVVLEEQVDITATMPEPVAADEELKLSGYTLNFASPQAPLGNVPGRDVSPVQPPPLVVPQKKTSMVRRLSSVMAALVVLLAATWAVWSTMQNSAQNEWEKVVSMNSREDYENFIKKHPESPEADMARQRLDSLETLAWESAAAANDTLLIHAYLDQYPEGRYQTEAILLLEKIRRQNTKEIIFSWQLLDTLLRITHEGGFAPYRFSFIQNGKAVQEIPRDSIGNFTVSLRDLPPGHYELWLADAEGRTIFDTLTISATQSADAESGKKKPVIGVSTPKTTPPKKPGTGTKTPATATPVPPVTIPPAEPPATDPAPADEDKPIPMRSAARMPVYPGCDNSNREKEQKCTERRIRDFIDNRLKYPDAAQRKNIQGTVTVYFTVERDGSITEVNAGNDIGGGCAAEAVKVVSSLPKFKPGQNSKAQPVRVRYHLPITFRLN